MSELKGDLARHKTPSESRLRGSLASPGQPQEQAPLGIGSALTQRDSGNVFIIESINKTKRYPEGLAVLKNSDGSTIALGVSDLEGKLKKENGPWRR